MSNVKIMMTADFEKALREHDKILRRTEKMLETQAKQRQESDKMRASLAKEREERRKVADEQRKLNQQADRYRGMIEKMRTPQQRFNAEVAKLKQVREGTDMTDKEYRRTLTMLRMEMDKEVRALDKSSDAYKKRSRDQQRANQITEQTMTQAERYKRDLRELNRLHQEGFLKTTTHARAVRQLGDSYRGRGFEAFLASPMVRGVGAMMGAGAMAGVAQGAISRDVAAQESVRGRALSLVEQRARGQEKSAANLFNLIKVLPEEFNNSIEKMEQLNYPGLPQLEEALGRVFSGSGGGTPQQKLDRTLDVIEAAAQVTRRQPEAFEKLAESLIIIADRTGKDAQEALGGLLEIGGLSQITEIGKVATTLGPTISFATQIADRTGQALEDVLKDAGAIFAAGSIRGTELRGESLGTAMITAFQVQEQFYKELPDHIAKLEKSVSDLEQTNEITKEDRARVEAAQVRQAEALRELNYINKIVAANPNAGEGLLLDQRKIASQYESATVALEQAIAGQTLNEEERETLELQRNQLAELKAIREENPTGLLQRYEALSGREYAVGLALASNPGERRFQQFIMDLFTQAGGVGKTSALIKENREQIEFSSEAVKEWTETLKYSTAILATSDVAATMEARRQQAEGRAERFGVATIIEQSRKAIEDTRLPPGFGTSFTNLANDMMGLPGYFERQGRVLPEVVQAQNRYMSTLMRTQEEVLASPERYGMTTQEAIQGINRLADQMQDNNEMMQRWLITNQELTSEERVRFWRMLNELKQQWNTNVSRAQATVNETITP